MVKKSTDRCLIDAVFWHFPPYLRQRDLLLAFSGGLDSTVLLHLLVRLRDAGQIAPFTVVHVHHGLQAVADDWVRHAQDITQAHKVPLRVEHVAVDPAAGGRGLEGAARKARYAVLASRMEEGGVLVTAHQKDDQAETFLLQLMRGAGVRGLSAMPPLMPFARGWHLRPLLGMRRTELECYAEQHDLAWVEDPSNLDTRFARNHVRHELLPVLNRHWPKATETLARAASRMAATEGLLHDLARMDLERALTDDPHVLAVPDLLQFDQERLHNALRFWLLQLGFPPPPEPRLAEMGHLLRIRHDAVPEVHWDAAVVRRWREGLYAMRRRPDPPSVLDRPWMAEAPLELPEFGVQLIPLRSHGQGLSWQQVREQGLSIRVRQGGERIKLTGQAHHKDVKQLLQEAAIPPWERARLPFIHVGDRLAQVGARWISADACAHDDEEGLVIQLREFG